MSVLSLPSTTDDVLLEELSPGELFKYGKTCKHIHSIVESYIRRRFQIDKLLATYFTPSQIADFRRLQASTGMLISGSTALQFFNRVVYPDSDLDVYVEHAYREDIGLWLLSIGYKYVPYPTSNSKTFQDDLDLNPDTTPSRMLTQRHFIESGQGYLGAQCVFTFVKQKPFRKVQMITSLNSPLERILSFHSTCVMNVITHNAAYSFFPRGTFIERRAQACTDRTTAMAAFKKYRERGWSLNQFITRDEFDDSTFAFARGIRYVGDAQCWTIPILAQTELPSLSNIESNSWLVEYTEHFFIKMAYSVVKSPRLRSTYLIDRDDEHLQEHLRIEIDMEKFESDEEFGDSLRFLDNKFTSFIDWYRTEHYDDSDNCEMWAAIRAQNIRNAKAYRRF
ncbi:hypothetical protein BJ912DRAFT_972907 [Pholiota molesta]|nr:hypothetical protein BJ912DRAFT_972907 [Pholiota molesta]